MECLFFACFLVAVLRILDPILSECFRAETIYLGSVEPDQVNTCAREQE